MVEPTELRPKDHFSEARKEYLRRDASPEIKAAFMRSIRARAAIAQADVKYHELEIGRRDGLEWEESRKKYEAARDYETDVMYPLFSERDAAYKDMLDLRPKTLEDLRLKLDVLRDYRGDLDGLDEEWLYPAIDALMADVEALETRLLIMTDLLQRADEDLRPPKKIAA